MKERREKQAIRSKKFYERSRLCINNEKLTTDDVSLFVSLHNIGDNLFPCLFINISWPREDVPSIRERTENYSKTFTFALAALFS
jgi:hypothetical protein